MEILFDIYYNKTLPGYLHSQSSSLLSSNSTAISLTALACMGAYGLYRYYFNGNEKNSLKVKETLCDSIEEDENTFLYLKNSDVIETRFLGRKFYKEAVESLPIVCVDIFLFNSQDKTYLLVKRKDPPAKGLWWVPGGRLYKGEGFNNCCKRKCWEEAGLDVQPLKILGFAATIFPDSAWNTQTHTVNVFMLAKITNCDKIELDNTCENHKWENIAIKPDDSYVARIYAKATKFINSEDFKFDG